MARVKLAYPKIPGSTDAPIGHCVAFEKYDGTNLHWVWDRELGWYAFGTRRNRFDFDEQGIADFNSSHDGYAVAPDIFRRNFATQLAEIFRKDASYDAAEITVFTEFVGPHSFAGLHQDSDEKELILFDVETPRGIIPPEKFIADFGTLNIARVIYRGKLTGKFTNDVREGKYNVAEGVVCKGGGGKTDLWMVKIKTNAYMKRLKMAFQENWEAYWE